MQITVIDNIMSAGKTSWSIQYMSRRIGKGRYLYITPYLSEVDRIISAVDGDMYQPEYNSCGKEDNLCELIKNRKNIACTHELFKRLSDESLELIRDNGYTLILDEVLEVISPVKIKPDSVKILIEADCISVDNDGYVIWNPKKDDYDTDFNEIKQMAMEHRLLCINNTMLLWIVPTKLFEVFKEVYIATYMFEASLLHYYFRLHKIQYQKKSIIYNNGKYDLVDYYEPDTTVYSKLIEIYEGNMNTNFNQQATSLSKRWFEKNSNKEPVDILKRNMNNYLRNQQKAKTTDILWCCFKDYAKKIDGAGYKYKDISQYPKYRGKTSFLAFNCRATNDYAERHVVAYCVNIYMHPAIVNFFAQNGIAVNQDAYALSELLQFLWRSAIRKGEPIHVYIPSDRMRGLIYSWLGREYIRSRNMVSQAL